jgi:hypothetical protein
VLLTALAGVGGFVRRGVAPGDGFDFIGELALLGIAVNAADFSAAAATPSRAAMAIQMGNVRMTPFRIDYTV